MEGLMSPEFKPGDLVVHFKRELLSEKEIEDDPMEYIYEIVCLALSTEEAITMVVYRELGPMRRTWCRPLIQFNEAVDKEIYPGVKQHTRFVHWDGKL